jgi:hypothetical protein
MGLFNASLLHQFDTIQGPYIAGLVQYLLRDPSIVYPATPVSQNCQWNNQSCVSYLLPGGIATVSPWPFNTSLPNALDYIVRSAPAYQIDFGRPMITPAWPSPACHEYGSADFAIQLCLENGSNPNELVAGKY